MSKLPPCPMCGKNKHVIVQADGYCCKIHGLFDDDPNEGGTAYTDPSRRMEKEEERRKPVQKRRW